MHNSTQILTPTLWCNVAFWQQYILNVKKIEINRVIKSYLHCNKHGLLQSDEVLWGGVGVGFQMVKLCHLVCVICHWVMLTHIGSDQIYHHDDIQFSGCSNLKKTMFLFHSLDALVFCFFLIVFKMPCPNYVSHQQQKAGRVNLVCKSTQRGRTHPLWRVRAYCGIAEGNSCQWRMWGAEGFNRKITSVVWGQTCHDFHCSTIQVTKLEMI